jgi:hypothetical protein
MVMLIAGCGPKGLSDDDIQYVRLSAGLMKLKAALPPNADSNYIQPKLDSTFKHFNMTREGYIAYTETLTKDPDHTQLVYTAIKDSLGLH